MPAFTLSLLIIFSSLFITAYFNITFYQLDKYLEMGLPWIGKPTRKKFNVNECRKWLDANTRNI